LFIFAIFYGCALIVSAGLLYILRKDN